MYTPNTTRSWFCRVSHDARSTRPAACPPPATELEIPDTSDAAFVNRILHPRPHKNGVIREAGLARAKLDDTLLAESRHRG